MNELNGALSSDCSNYSGIYSLTILTILANYSVSQHSWNKLSYRSVDRIVNKIYFITGLYVRVKGDIVEEQKR